MANTRKAWESWGRDQWDWSVRLVVCVCASVTKDHWSFFDTLITRGHRQQCLTLSMREGFSCETLVARGSVAPVFFQVFGKTCRACPCFERAGLGFRILLTKLTAFCFVLTACLGKHREGLGVLGTRPVRLVGQACCVCVHFCH